jgi:hypothetical protein
VRESRADAVGKIQEPLKLGAIVQVTPPTFFLPRRGEDEVVGLDQWQQLDDET